MAISPGDRLGPYEIQTPIGAGGMGDVWMARDTRLGRTVAIKVSKEKFSERFEHEARAIAALNHRNICQLYDVGPNYLVMELIEGQTLGERMAEGRIPIDEALAVARQIADALEEAHEKGITHRDLKPGNVKIKPDGTVKVLDFGLAKIGGTPSLPGENSHSPTVTIGQTEAGVVLGTAAYMSPEQAKGKQVDARSDIYAFGAVLYEMLSGKRLHRGETTTEILASVIRDEPRWDEIPAHLQRLLRRCLEKDPQKRLRHIGDVMALVDDAAEGNKTVTGKSSVWSRPLPWIAIAVVLLILAGGAMWAMHLGMFAEHHALYVQLAPPGRLGVLHVRRKSRRICFIAGWQDGCVYRPDRREKGSMGPRKLRN